MKLSTLLRVAACLPAILLVLHPAPASAVLGIEHEDIGWTTQNGVVTFTLHFTNPGPDTSQAATGALYSQEYGAFVPRAGEIGTFNVPSLAPDSFFDIEYSVSLNDLPPSATEILPGAPSAPGGVQDVAVGGCPPDDHWDGNVDVIWTDPVGGGGETFAHYGTLQSCPGGGNSYIHVVTQCSGTSTWSLTALCPGYSATLVNEDFSPAPAGLPSGWSGYICVGSDASVAVGTVCCFQVLFVCNNITVPVDLCVEACDWSTVPVEKTTWSGIKVLYK
jgi:hypothetical protein